MACGSELKCDDRASRTGAGMLVADMVSPYCANGPRLDEGELIILVLEAGPRVCCSKQCRGSAHYVCICCFSMWIMMKMLKMMQNVFFFSGGNGRRS